MGERNKKENKKRESGSSEWERISCGQQVSLDLVEYCERENGDGCRVVREKMGASVRLCCWF